MRFRELLARGRRRKEQRMPSVKDVEQVADDLENLVGELRSELQSGVDFERLVQIADEISEHADNAATTFNSINETLQARIREISGGSSGSSGSKRNSGSKQRSGSSSSSSSSGGGS
jgi:uncharacterized membrane protein YgcG